MSEKITGSKQDLKTLQAYYETLRASKQNQKQTEEVKEQQVKPQTKELGDKLLEQPYAKVNLFANQVFISKQDTDELNEMFAMAGIKGQVPTKQVYERIGASVAQFNGVFKDIETENNIEALFSSTNFKTLDNIFFS